VLVVNDTKVLPRVLFAGGIQAAQFKLLPSQTLSTNTSYWEALSHANQDALKVGEVVDVMLGEENAPSHPDGYKIRIVDFTLGPDGFKRLIVDWDQKKTSTTCSRSGFMPHCPPYIHRDYRHEEESGHRKEDLFSISDCFRFGTGGGGSANGRSTLPRKKS